MNKINIHIIPDSASITEFGESSKAYDFKWEFNNFVMPEMLERSREAEEEIVKCSKIAHRGEDTIHGAFFDVLFDSREEKIRALSNNRAYRSMEIADRLGCKGVVFHTNFNPWITNSVYRERWSDYSSLAYQKLLDEFPGMEIYVENMFDNDPYEIRRLLDKVDHDRFNCCFDTAHAELSTTPLEEWFDVLEDRIKHMHMNDNNKKDDSHSAFGDGVCDIDYALKRALALPRLESVLLEMNGNSKIKKSYARILEVFG